MVLLRSGNSLTRPCWWNCNGQGNVGWLGAHQLDSCENHTQKAVSWEMFSRYQRYDVHIADCITTSAANRLIFLPPGGKTLTQGCDPELEQTFSMWLLLDLPHLSAKQKVESQVPDSLIFNWKWETTPTYKNIFPNKSKEGASNLLFFRSCAILNT